MTTHRLYRAPQSPEEQKSFDAFWAALSKENRSSYNKHGYITVVSSTGRTWHIICNSYMSNCWQVHSGQEPGLKKDGELDAYSHRGYCAHINTRYDIEGRYLFPYWDHWLAQALTIKTNEELFLELAY